MDYIIRRFESHPQHLYVGAVGTLKSAVGIRGMCELIAYLFLD